MVDDLCQGNTEEIGNSQERGPTEKLQEFRTRWGPGRSKLRPRGAGEGYRERERRREEREGEGEEEEAPAWQAPCFNLKNMGHL